MYRAYIKNLDDIEYDGYVDIPHKGHFVYGNLVKGNPNDDVDAIVGNLIEITDEYINTEWWCSIEKGSANLSSCMKDSEGKEIYEGDFVSLSPNLVCKVIFKNGKFKVVGESLYLDLCDVIRDCKIVGNIKENSELLGG